MHWLTLGFIVAGFAAGVAGAQDLWKATLFSNAGQYPREIPTNRWVWVEVEPGIFAAEYDAEAARESVRALEAAVARRHLRFVTGQRPEPIADEAPVLWCLEWHTTAMHPRLACVEGQG